MTVLATTTEATSTSHRPRRFALRWLATSLAFPPSGLAAAAVIDRVDGPTAAVVGGAIVGTGVGLAQRFALRGHGASWRWVWITAVGMGAGLGLGAAAVSYGTSTTELVVMGLVTGMVLGPSQATALRSDRLVTPRGARAWAAVVPLLLALGWFTTASAGVDVDQHFAVFGITGALTSAALGGAVLSRVVDHHRHA